LEKPVKVLDKASMAHELMSKRLNAEEKIIHEDSFKRMAKAPILNLSNFGVENNSKKKERPSPLDRPKNYSKKK
jgi:hypothetical protein